MAENKEKPEIIKECQEDLEMLSKDGQMYARVLSIIDKSNLKTLFQDSDDENVDVSVPSYNETE